MGPVEIGQPDPGQHADDCQGEHGGSLPLIQRSLRKLGVPGQLEGDGRDQVPAGRNRRFPLRGQFGQFPLDILVRRRFTSGRGGRQGRNDRPR